MLSEEAWNRFCQEYNIERAEWIRALQNLLSNSENKPQDQLTSDSKFWKHETNNQVEDCVYVNYVKKLMAYINKHVGVCSFILWALLRLNLHSIIVCSSKLLNKIIIW